VNYDFSNLSKIERGIHEPSLPLLEKIAAVYNVGLDYFFKSDQYSREEQEFMDHLALDFFYLNIKRTISIKDFYLSTPNEG
jgi:transcriptional regulator with XRE-family HTH domain